MVPRLASAYLKHHAFPKKRAKSIAGDRSMISNIILPTWGRRTVSEITGRNMQELHSGMAKTPYQANRVLALLSKMFHYQFSGDAGLIIQQKASTVLMSTSESGGWPMLNLSGSWLYWQIIRTSERLMPLSFSSLLGLRHRRDEIGAAVRLDDPIGRLFVDDLPMPTGDVVRRVQNRWFKELLRHALHPSSARS